MNSFGDQIAPIAVAFAALATTHSATALRLVLAGRTVPLVVIVLIGGAWADRLPRKSPTVTSDLVRLCTQGAFALILTQHAPALWAMVLLQAGNGAASAFFRPASTELVQEAVSVAVRQSANGLLSATSDISAVAGPVIAAILIALVGNAWAVGAPRISTEIVAALAVDIGRSVALFDITHFVIPNGDFGTRGGRTRKSSEGAHDHGGEHRKYADLHVICDHPS